MESDIELLSESDDESSTGSSIITNVAPIPCNHCHETFRTAQDLSWHQSTYTICNINRALLRLNSTPLQTFIPTTSQDLQRSSLYHIAPPSPPPSSHTMLFPMHGSGNYNRRFHPYVRPIPEVPIVSRTDRDYNNIDGSLGRTMDLISLIDKPIDELPVVLQDGSTNNINLDLKL